MNDVFDTVNIFNQMQGRLRISVTHQCQLRCRFCHREGIVNHWVNQYMNQDFFDSLVHAYAEMGGRYLEITGGEPTLHPAIVNLLQIGRATGCETILCTNGLRLDRAMKAAKTECIQLIKLSLHHDGSSPDRARKLLGDSWNFSHICRNITEILALHVPVQLIFTQTRDNQDQLDSILRLALKWKVDVQVVDLITSRAGDPSIQLGYRSGPEAEEVASRYATLDRIVTDRTGAVLRLYQTPDGASWEIKDYHFGVLHSGMCMDCPLIDLCGEGVYALRVDSLGVVKPCLLREDLEKNLLPYHTKKKYISMIIKEKLEEMLSDPLEWSYRHVTNIEKIS